MKNTDHINENINPEFSDEIASENNSISIKKGLFLLLPTAFAGIVFLFCNLFLELISDTLLYTLTANLSGQMAYAINALFRAIPYIVAPLIYALWLLISSRFISFTGGKKIYILSGIAGYALGSATVGLVTELLAFFLSAVLVNAIGKYTIIVNIASLFARSILVPLVIFAFSMLIFAIVCKKKQKKT